MFEKRKIFWKILNNPDSVRVHFPGSGVSGRPIYSIGYANCNAVVLFRSPYAALSHLDTRFFPYTEENAQELLDKILSKPGGESEISAVLIGGDESHFERNMKFLRNQKIPIIGKHIDYWNDYGILPLFKSHKDVVVIPETKEVIIYRFPGRYRKLSP